MVGKCDSQFPFSTFRSSTFPATATEIYILYGLSVQIHIDGYILAQIAAKLANGFQELWAWQSQSAAMMSVGYLAGKSQRMMAKTECRYVIALFFCSMVRMINFACGLFFSFFFLPHFFVFGLIFSF